MPEVVLAPQPGSQVQFLTCPAREVLYEGTRGPGKTLALLMDFLQHVGKGYGAHWRGILFRQTYPQLADVITKSKEWFWKVFPLAQYNKAEYTWTFPDGEQLLLRHMDSADQYWDYHGHEYPYIAFEELTNWPDGSCYDMMKACNRSSHPGMPRKYRATCNPWGAGHGWVKARFIDPAPALTPIRDTEKGWVRVRIHGDVGENSALLNAQPDYVDQLEQIEDEALRKAWRFGDWDIAAGGIFTDVWSPPYHVVVPFEIPPGWELSRSFDWGSSRPFSVGWWARCNGEQPKDTKRSYARGTWVRFAEWYGWNGKANQGCNMLAAEVARGILEREKQLGLKVREGVADSAIFDNGSGLSNESIATTMERLGVQWTPANKGPGSRVQGWEKMRELFVNAKKTPMEKPGLVVFETCRQFIRTVPTLMRDDKKPDDIDSDMEDHCVAGDTLVVTDSGLHPISELVGTSGMALTHEGRWRRYYDVRRTRRNAPCIRVVLSDGQSFVCTTDHRVWTSKGWMEAGRLVDCGSDETGYRNKYAKHHFGNDSGIPRGAVLPLRDLLSAQGHPTSPQGVGGCERADSGELSRPPSGREPSQQSARESGANSWDGSSVWPYVASGTQEALTDSRQFAGDAGGRSSVAPLSGGQGVAQATRAAAKSARGRAQDPDLRPLPGAVRAHGEDCGGNLLQQQLQVSSQEGSWRGPCDKDLPGMPEGIQPEQILEAGSLLQGLWVEVAAIEEVEPRDVYNLEVEEDHSFTLASGVSVHNCADEVRYRLMTEIPRAGVVKLSTWV